MIRENFREMNREDENRVYQSRVLEKVKYDSKCLEVGVFNGYFAEKIHSRNPHELHLVDPWEHQPGQGKEQGGYPQEVQDARFEKVLNKFQHLSQISDTKVFIRREYSVQASARYPDNYFDFIYVDGDHSYQGVTDDINAWWRTLKPGGWMCGDDYAPRGSESWGVIEAVNNIALTKGMKPPHPETLKDWWEGSHFPWWIVNKNDASYVESHAIDVTDPHYRIYVDSFSLNFKILGGQWFMRKS